MLKSPKKIKTMRLKSFYLVLIKKVKSITITQRRTSLQDAQIVTLQALYKK